MSNYDNRPASLKFDHASSTVANAHFTGANGIPVGAYREFFEHLENSLSISALDSRGCWPNEPLPINGYNWHHHADDLIAGIESNISSPLIGIGHSMGAVITMLAALKRPELFRKLILIEPPSAPSWFSVQLMQILPVWLIHKFSPFIRGSHNRKRTFASREEFFQRYRNHPTFQHLSQRCFNDYTQLGLVASDKGGFKLLCHPTWESTNFRTVPYIWPLLSRVSQPTLILRAEHSYLYSAEQFDKQCAQLGARIESQQLDQAYHLAPLELPEAVAAQIIKWA